MKALFYGYIRKTGKFEFSPGQAAAFNKYVRHESRRDNDVFAAISIEPVHKKRTIRQNNLYWLRNTVLSNELGMHKDDCHALLMKRCHFGKEKIVAGERCFARDTSTKLSKKQFSALIEEQDKIAMWLNEDREENERLILPEKESNVVGVH